MNALFFLVFIALFCLAGCGRKSPELFQTAGRQVTEEIIATLSQIDDLDGLIEAVPRLESLFDALVEQMIEARKWQIKHKTSWQPDEKDYMLSQQLAGELNRLLRNPLAAHFLEKAQQKPLERLDAFEKRNGLQH